MGAEAKNRSPPSAARHTAAAAAPVCKRKNGSLPASERSAAADSCPPTETAPPACAPSAEIPRPTEWGNRKRSPASQRRTGNLQIWLRAADSDRQSERRRGAAVP